MTDIYKAAQQLLSELETYFDVYPHMQKGYVIDAITDLRTALAPPAPVQYQRREIGEGGWMNCTKEQYENAKAMPEMDARVITNPPEEQPAGQEPVAWMYRTCGELRFSEKRNTPGMHRTESVPLYTAPQPKPDHLRDATKMVPLTDDAIWHKWIYARSNVLMFARAIERAHGIGGRAEP